MRRPKPLAIRVFVRRQTPEEEKATADVLRDCVETMLRDVLTQMFDGTTVTEMNAQTKLLAGRGDQKSTENTVDNSHKIVY